MSATYLMTDELSAKIEYDVRTIRQRLKDSVLLEGTHHVRAFGGRKILSVWEATEVHHFHPHFDRSEAPAPNAINNLVSLRSELV